MEGNFIFSGHPPNECLTDVCPDVPASIYDVETVSLFLTGPGGFIKGKPSCKLVQ
jgi:hypothetical protein